MIKSLRHSGGLCWQIWVNICSGNSLVPDGTKLLPEPMLTSLQRLPMLLFCIMSLKIVLFKLQPHLSGTGELTYIFYHVVMTLYSYHVCTTPLRDGLMSVVCRGSHDQSGLALSRQVSDGCHHEAINQEMMARWYQGNKILCIRCSEHLLTYTRHI